MKESRAELEKIELLTVQLYNNIQMNKNQEGIHKQKCIFLVLQLRVHWTQKHHTITGKPTVSVTD